MALTGAERQARHRERVKEKLRNAVPGEPLRNDDLLETLQFAFIVAERKARAEALDRIGAAPNLPYDSGWDAARASLTNFDEKIENLTQEFFVGLIAAAAVRLGDHLVMETYREFLAEEVKRREPKTAPVVKKIRKRVT